MSVAQSDKSAVTYHPSVCPLDCPDTCSLSVGVEAGEIVSVSGSDANPFTESAICSKVARFYPEFVHGDRRLRAPLRRTGKKGEGRFEPIGWDEALDTVYQRFTEIRRDYGAEAIAPFNYAGPHGILAGASMDMRFFYRLGATQLDRKPLCAGIWALAWNTLYGAVPGMSPEQALKSELVMIWGNNTAVSSLHFHKVLKKVREQGGKVIVVDPRTTKIAAQADLHLPLRPGTDVVLAHAIAVLLEKNGGIDKAFVNQHVSGYEPFMQEARRFSLQEAADICGLPAADIEKAAALYQSASPAAINVGIGPERNRCGGAGVRAALALPALAGKFGVDGGGIVGKSGMMVPKTTEQLQRPDLLKENTRVVNILDVPTYIENPPDGNPLKGLFLYNHNAVAVHPDQNRMRKVLEREDLFVVACDVEMNDSVKLADIVLPACTHFEHHDLYAAYGQNYLQSAAPVIPPVGEALPNTEIFRRLAMRFGFDEDLMQADDKTLMADALDWSDERLQGTDPESLSQQGAVKLLYDGEPAVLFKNCFPQTGDGKIHLSSQALADQYDAFVPKFQPLQQKLPLTLITPASMKRTNATFGGVGENIEMQVLDMHPDDAEVRGLKKGDEVAVSNELGEVRLKLRVTKNVRTGVVSCDKGAWLEASSSGQSCNALIPATKADIAGGACYNDAAVDVRAVS